MDEVRFCDEVELERYLAEAAQHALEAVRRAARRQGSAGAVLTHLAGGLAAELARCGGTVVLGKEIALDLAAGLLVAADELHRGGLHLEAFALEGLQGRVMEAALRPT